jgi:adenosine deaminase
MTELADRGITLDVCPTSNLRLRAIPDLSEHPLPQLLSHGVRCSVNADDPLLFDTNILDEYELCRDLFGLGDEALADIARTSIDASSLSSSDRQRATGDVYTWLQTTR